MTVGRGRRRVGSIPIVGHSRGAGWLLGGGRRVRHCLLGRPRRGRCLECQEFHEGGLLSGTYVQIDPGMKSLGGLWDGM